MELNFIKGVIFSIFLLILIVIKCSSNVTIPKGILRKIISGIFLFAAIYSFYNLVSEILYPAVKISTILAIVFTFCCEIFAFFYISKITIINKTFAIYDRKVFFKNNITIHDNYVTLNSSSNVIHIDLNNLN
ncbi:hypothetical protein [Paraclostridium sordellii]|uniref:hypothetical protein n=1 Tax=Paraclostridium sordellii TaxID=1505 RepID=UPI000E467BBD|nr:hypothetical protein [Paeniclostridium sordellii]RGX03146.1 hypothetical protein DWV40_14675 [Paeniclostridium sordellii]